MNRGYNPYRWVIMLFLWLGTSAQGLTYMNTPPMEIPVSLELGLSATQVALWVNVVFVMSIFLSIPAGMLADKFEIKRYAGVGLALLGPFALLRGFTDTFPALVFVSVLSSVGWVIFFTSIPRIIRSWFPPREVGTAMGVVFAGYGVGSAVGVALSQPLFGSDWRRCFAILGIWGVVAAGMWWVGARKSPVQSGEVSSGEGPGIFSGLKEVLRIKTVWMLVIIFFFYIGGRTAWLTFSFPYLVTVRDMPESITGYVLLLDWAGYIAGSSIIAVLSDKLGLRRPFFYASGAVLGGLFLIFPFISTTAALGVYALLVGMSFGAINPMIFVVCAEAEEIGPGRTGSATGVVISLANIGAVVIPTTAGYLLRSLETAGAADYRLVWGMVALSMFMIIVFTTLLRETGARASDA